ncbi:hypothetical protein CsSME_00007805 [Camellia sinensis var. sinensis]
MNDYPVSDKYSWQQFRGSSIYPFPVPEVPYEIDKCVTRPRGSTWTLFCQPIYVPPMEVVTPNYGEANTKLIEVAQCLKEGRPLVLQLKVVDPCPMYSARAYFFHQRLVDFPTEEWLCNWMCSRSAADITWCCL